MAARAARVRTESMAQRLAKKPISEGFELWDKGFFLGAMRLFIFKAESSPPFQLGPCLDAVAHLLERMGELTDAAENFGFAAEKYELIQQSTLSKLMKIKMIQCADGTEEAIKALDALIAEIDADASAADLPDAKSRGAIARVYNARAEALLALDEGDAKKALDDSAYAAKLGWDRSHIALNNIANAKLRLGDAKGAVEAYEKAIEANPKFLQPYLSIANILRADEPQRALEFYTKAIEVHPRSSLIRDKAYLMSELKDDAGAIALLDKMLADPQVEEGEGIGEKGSTEATLFKAKAAILADLGQMEEALAAATSAIEKVPTDSEAAQMIADIKASAVDPEPVAQ